MNHGATRSWPRSSSAECCSTIPINPPIAEPKTTPKRAGSSTTAPESAKASRAACTARTTLRSSFRASFGVTTLAGSKSFTSAAIRTGNSLASNAWMKSIPLRPSTAACQVDGASLPSGVTAPSPVTATLLTALA